MNPEFPETIGRFEIRGLLGEGGMGQVLHGFDPKMAQDVAIKVIHPALLTRSKVYARATRELQVMLSLRAHPNIVTVLDYVESPFAVVMEFLEGQNLYDVLEESGGPLPYDDALKHGLEMVDALGFAHEKGVLHRDIKSGNVMLVQLGKKRKVKILDFGLAGFLEDDQDQKLTRAGARLGTPGYMAPEQHLGQTVDARTDIYAAGIVLFEMFTGKMPFFQHSSSEYELTRAQLELPMLRPTEVIPTLPEALNNIILKATARQPDDRYTSCEELAADLERVQRGEAVQAPTSALDSSPPASVAPSFESAAPQEPSVPASTSPSAAPATIFEDEEDQVSVEITGAEETAPPGLLSKLSARTLAAVALVAIGITVAVVLILQGGETTSRRLSNALDPCVSYEKKICRGKANKKACVDFKKKFAEAKRDGDDGFGETCLSNLASWDKLLKDKALSRRAGARSKARKARCEAAEGTPTPEEDCKCSDGTVGSPTDCEGVQKKVRAANEKLERLETTTNLLCSCTTSDCSADQWREFDTKFTDQAWIKRLSLEKENRRKAANERAKECRAPWGILSQLKKAAERNDITEALRLFGTVGRTSNAYSAVQAVMEGLATHKVFNTWSDYEAPYLALRSKHRKPYYLMAKMPDGEKLYYINSVGVWWKVAYLRTGQVGWAHSNWITPTY